MIFALIAVVIIIALYIDELLGRVRYLENNVEELTDLTKRVSYLEAKINEQYIDNLKFEADVNDRFENLK